MFRVMLKSFMQKVVTKKLNFVMRSLVHTYFFVVVVDGLVEIFKDKFAVCKILDS